MDGTTSSGGSSAPSHPPICPKACTDAYALNNIGVCLMLRGQFENAVTTLKDAMSIVRLALGCNTPAEQQTLGAFTQDKLQAGSSRLCSVTSAKSFENTRSYRLNAIESNDFRTLKATVHQTKTQMRSTDFSAILIRERCVCTSDDDEDDEMDVNIHAGIILYNLGLACFILTIFPGVRTAMTSDRWKLVAPSYDASNICESASYKSFLKAHTAFSRRIDTTHDPMKELEATYFSMLSLCCSSRLLRAAGNADSEVVPQIDQAVNDMLSVAENQHVLQMLMMSSGLTAKAA